MTKSRDVVMLARQTRHELVALMRTPLTMILCVGFPLLSLVMLALMFGNAVVDEASGVRLVQFLAPALASFASSWLRSPFLLLGCRKHVPWEF